MDPVEKERIEGRNYDEPGFLDRTADWFSRQYRGASRAMRGWPTGLWFATALALAGVEAFMVAKGWQSLQGVGVAYISGACLVAAFIWVVHEFMVSIRTNESGMEKFKWGFAALIVYGLATFGFFATQVNNATMDYDFAAQRGQERSQLVLEIRTAQNLLRLKPPPDFYEADKADLEMVQNSAIRWGLSEFSDCAQEGGFRRQAKVDICNRWGDLRTRLAESEGRVEERDRLIKEIADKTAELDSKPAVQGDAAWDAVAKLMNQDVSTSRALSLAAGSSLLIWFTAFFWDQLISQFIARRRAGREDGIS